MKNKKIKKNVTQSQFRKGGNEAIPEMIKLAKRLQQVKELSHEMPGGRAWWDQDTASVEVLKL